MPNFEMYTPETAPGEARPILEGVQKGLGFVPNLIAYMAAHTTIAQIQDVDTNVIRAVRDGTLIENEKLEALRAFTSVMVERRGFAEKSDVESFLAAGYSQQHVLDIVLGVGLKVLSNYTNHIVDTELDEAFSANEWNK